MDAKQAADRRKWQAEAAQAEGVRQALARSMLAGMLNGAALGPLLVLWSEVNAETGAVPVADKDIYARSVALELRRLQRHVDRILAAGRDAGMPVDAVNVADLRCIETGLVVSGGSGEAPIWRAVVSEVAPDAVVFRTWLSDCLRQYGWDRVEIVTEW